MATAPMTRHYLVTGAARGIGRGLSRLLLHKGHRVFLVDNNVEELNNTAQRLGRSHERGVDFETRLCNLRNPPEITAAADAAGKFFNGRLDVLVNNAAYTGGASGKPLSDMSTWTESIETNVTAPMLLSQACQPLLDRSSSSSSSSCIIHMSSTRAFMSELNNEPYSASKAGLLGLSQAMAVSLAQLSIRSNAILPGWIHVENECLAADQEGRKWEEGLSKEDHRWHLVGRVGKVEDVFAAVEYLAESEFVTGAEMVVDGGVTRKMVYPE